MVRKKVGCKGFDLDYGVISEEYLGGKTLKELGQKYDISQWTLLDNFKKLGVRKHVKRKLNKKAFSKFTQESCYWAGFLAADGWINGRYYLGCEISTKDAGHLYKLKAFLESTAEIKYRSREKSGKIINSSLVQINSVELVGDLKQNFNITTNKSLTYEVPKQIPDHLVRHFIRGYIDGDGSLGWHKHNNKPRLSICSGSRELLVWVLDVFQIKVPATANPSILKRKNSNLHTIEFIGNQVYGILNWLQEGATYYLDRKSEV